MEEINQLRSLTINGRTIEEIAILTTVLVTLNGKLYSGSYEKACAEAAAAPMTLEECEKAYHRLLNLRLNGGNVSADDMRDLQIRIMELKKQMETV
jgi:hypothetical protein